jgi:hypothetical protein
MPFWQILGMYEPVFPLTRTSMGSSSYLSTLHVYSYSFVENKRKNCDKKEWKDNFVNSILQSLKRQKVLRIMYGTKKSCLWDKKVLRMGQKSLTYGTKFLTFNLNGIKVPKYK